mgnify:CR=1 FL=1
MSDVLTLSEATSLVQELKSRVQAAVFGQEKLVNEAICALLSNGHLLMTGAPGLAKTTLVRVFAKHLGLEFGRVQFTPDLLPSDIIGSEILNIDPTSHAKVFDFSHGPVFTNLLLADEINRASPRTQSALLEAMQERTCTVGGKVHALPIPFMVFATQNPFESEGTFPLPEAQLDRFLLHSLVDYPDDEAENRILLEHSKSKLIGETFEESLQEGKERLSGGMVRKLIEKTKSVHIDEKLVSCIASLVRSSRPDDPNCPEELRPIIWYGAGPRAGISIISLARSLALIQGEESVRWSHIKQLGKPALRHRIRLSAQAARDQISADSLIEELMVRIEDKFKLSAKGIV